jgi:5-bromo-4-chloroindolyl phosphate hydrolysis protein
VKTKVIPSAIPIYFAAVVWAIFGLFGHLYELSNILFAICLSLAAFFISRKFLPGRIIEVEDTLSTGDRAVDEKLKSSAEALKRLRGTAAVAPSAVAEKLNRIHEAGRKILSAVVQKHAQFDEVRKFMEYYLPTTDKLMAQYGQLSTAGAGEKVKAAMGSIESSLDMIAKAFEKQLDRLYADEALDITTDIQVLETMMASDGLTGEGMRGTAANSGSAAGSAAEQAEQKHENN